MLKRFFASNFIRSGASYSAINFGVSLLAYFLNLLIARSFSLTDYGEYMSAMAYVVLFSIPLGAFSMMVIKKIGAVEAKNREAMGKVIEKWLLGEFVQFWPLILLGSSLLSFLMYYKSGMSLLAILFIFIVVIESLFLGFYSAVLQAYKEFLKVGLFSLVTILIKMFFIISITLTRPNLFWLFFSLIISGLVTILIGHFFIVKTKNNEEQKMKPLVAENYALASLTTYLKRKSVLIPLLTSLGLIGLTNIDIILVKKFFSSDVSGLYGSLSLLGRIVLYVAAPFSAVAFSYFTGKDSRHQSRKILLLVTLVIAAVGFGASALYGFFPSLVVKVIFGDKFLEVSSLVWLAAVFGAFYSLINLYSQYFIAKNSAFGYLGILAVVLQTIGIYIYHENLHQVLVVNIVISSTLFLLYLLEVMRREVFYAKR